MIVVPCGSGPHTDPCMDTNYVAPGGGGGGGGDTGSDVPPPCVDGEPCAHKVQIGWVKLTKNYDGLFAGGSEIKWKSIDGIKYFDSSEVDTTEIYISQHFSRDEIHDKDWDEPNTQFDQNWEEYELAKDFKIYEADGNGSDTITLGVKIDLGPVQSDFNFEVNLSNDRANIFKTTYQRDVFFAENDYDLGNGTKEGVQIRHAGELHWTMPITEIALDN